MSFINCWLKSSETNLEKQGELKKLKPEKIHSGLLGNLNYIRACIKLILCLSTAPSAILGCTTKQREQADLVLYEDRIDKEEKDAMLYDDVIHIYDNSPFNEEISPVTSIEVICNDGIDNDNDYFIDCIDPDCRGYICADNGAICQLGICICPGGEGYYEVTCNDHQDNDCDGKTDCDDSNCANDPTCPEALCDDELDNDKDFLTDCDDIDCHYNPSCVEPPEPPASENLCELVDNRGCSWDDSCCFSEEENLMCSNGIDEDMDGMIDCKDFNCYYVSVCQGITGVSCSSTEDICDDGIDNDCDGHTDCTDVDDCPDGTLCGPEGFVCNYSTCSCSSGYEELNCWDGIDNDCDGFRDCKDHDCTGQFCTPSNDICEFGSCTCPGNPVNPFTGNNIPEIFCYDNIDNDCDGMTDCDDPDCDDMLCGQDGSTCQDSKCPFGETTCEGGFDDDLDGLIDCEDPDCEGQNCTPWGEICHFNICMCVGPSGEFFYSEEILGDNEDNDCDGSIDEPNNP